MFIGAFCPCIVEDFVSLSHLLKTPTIQAKSKTRCPSSMSITHNEKGHQYPPKRLIATFLGCYF